MSANITSYLHMKPHATGKLLILSLAHFFPLGDIPRFGETAGFDFGETDLFGEAPVFFFGEAPVLPPIPPPNAAMPFGAAPLAPTPFGETRGLTGN